MQLVIFSSVFVITYHLFPFVQDDLDEHVDVTDSRLRVMLSFMYFKSTSLVAKQKNIEYVVVCKCIVRHSQLVTNY